MRVGHPEPLDRVSLEVELDQHDRLVADHPAVVARLDRDNLRRLVLDDAAVGVSMWISPCARKPTCACMQRSVPTEPGHDGWVVGDEPVVSRGNHGAGMPDAHRHA